MEKKASTRLVHLNTLKRGAELLRENCTKTLLWFLDPTPDNYMQWVSCSQYFNLNLNILKIVTLSQHHWICMGQYCALLFGGDPRDHSQYTHTCKVNEVHMNKVICFNKPNQTRANLHFLTDLVNDPRQSDDLHPRL